MSEELKPCPFCGAHSDAVRALLAAPAPAGTVGDEPDMCWNADNPEDSSGDPEQVADYEVDGIGLTSSDAPVYIDVLCAKSLPNRQMKVWVEKMPDGNEYTMFEFMPLPPAPVAVAQEDHGLPLRKLEAAIAADPDIGVAVERIMRGCLVPEKPASPSVDAEKVMGLVGKCKRHWLMAGQQSVYGNHLHAAAEQQAADAMLAQIRALLTAAPAGVGGWQRVGEVVQLDDGQWFPIWSDGTPAPGTVMYAKIEDAN